MAKARKIAQVREPYCMKGNCLSSKSLLSLAVISALSAQAFAAEEDNQSDTQKDENIETIEVTGSRMKLGDPSARVDVITAEDISARGLVTAEDIIRSIPQNFSSINGTNNLRTFNPLDVGLGVYGLGTSTANLRGLGSSNTLVLLNSRRMAGAAGNDNFFANLRNIPAASIERVEIMLDGGSAIYGSDAIGGVINIITKKGYTGGVLTAQIENSSTDADSFNLNGSYGYTWDSGDVDVSIGHSKKDPINNYKTGYVTKDYRHLFGGNTRYDFRQPFQLEGIAVSTVGPYSPNKVIYRNQDGTNVTVEDLHDITRNDYKDAIPKDAGGKTENTSLNLNLEQEITDKLTGKLGVTLTKNETVSRVRSISPGAIKVPASNAFSPYHNLPKEEQKDLYVWYDPSYEISTGLLSWNNQTSNTNFFLYDVELNYEINEDTELVFQYSQSESKGKNVHVDFGQTTTSLDKDEAKEAKIEELLVSSDPNVAINLFGDGSAQNPTISELKVVTGIRNNKSTTEELDLYLTGQVVELPAGKINYAIGGEYRKEGVSGNSELLKRRYGVTNPDRKLNAVYAETSIPLFGKDNAVTGIESLIMTLQARYDNYSMEGARGTVENGDIKLITSSFDNISPKIGFAWKPIVNLTVRTNWSESFKAPTFTDLFGTSRLDDDKPTLVYDPLITGDNPYVLAKRTFRKNPDLKPEVSTTFSLGLSYNPSWHQDTQINIDYSDIKIKDRISGNFQLSNLLPAKVYGNIPEFFVRDESGRLIKSISMPINISERVSKNIDIDISSLFATSFGEFTPRVYYSRVLEQYDRPIAGAEPVSLVGEYVGIDKYKVQASLGWQYEQWSGSVFANYTPSYIGNAFQHQRNPLPNTKVDSYTTIDMSLNYRFNDSLSFKVGGRNVFNADFPFVLSTTGQPYDTTRVDLRGRVLFAEISYQFGE